MKGLDELELIGAEVDAGLDELAADGLLAARGEYGKVGGFQE